MEGELNLANNIPTMSKEEKWHFQSATGKVKGPVVNERLTALISDGTLGANDKIKPADSEDWTTIAESVFKKQLPPSKSPAKPSPNNNRVDLDDALKQAKDLGRKLLHFTVRSFSGNFHGKLATEEEKTKLSTASIAVTEPAIVNFLAWRRSAFGLGAVFLCLSFLFSIPQIIESFETRNMPAFIHVTTVIFIISSLVTIGLIVLALMNWANYQLSRLLGRVA